jgi:hypothetical protein
MIKVSNTHRDSVLHRMYMTFDTDNTATGSHNIAIICPVEARLESLEYVLDAGTSASAGTGLHTYVYSVGKSTALIDYSQTGAVTHGMSAANSYKKLSATASVWNTAGTVITISISGTGIFGLVHGIATFVINEKQVK